MAQDSVQAELARRLHVWSEVQARGGPDEVQPALVKSLRIHRGQQGVPGTTDLTAPLTDSGAGVTVGVLHTGSSYADDLTEDGVIYHYPVTERGSRDERRNPGDESLW